MRNEWVDIDLDYFNDTSTPMADFEKILLSLPRKCEPPSAPVFFCVEHHHVLPIVKRAIRSKWISTPMSIFRVDAHHDYYYTNRVPRNDKDVDCGNFGFRVPLYSYNRFVWVNGERCADEYWASARNWIRRRGKKAEMVSANRICWNKNKVGLITITVSPDFQDLSYNLSPMLELAAEYFGISKRPFVKKSRGQLETAGDAYESKDWEIRPRTR